MQSMSGDGLQASKLVLNDAADHLVISDPGFQRGSGKARVGAEAGIHVNLENEGSAGAIDPALRGRGVGGAAARAVQLHLLRDAGFHRIQMEVYGFNERALRHAERAGWIREGVRRSAYLRDGAWVDGILFGLVEEAEIAATLCRLAAAG